MSNVSSEKSFDRMEHGFNIIDKKLDCTIILWLLFMTIYTFGEA